MLWALTSWVLDWLRHNKFSWRVDSKTCKHMLKVFFLLQNCCHITWTFETYVSLSYLWNKQVLVVFSECFWELLSICVKDEFKGLVVIQDAFQARSWRILGVGRCVFCLEGFLVDAMSFSRSESSQCLVSSSGIRFDMEKISTIFPCILSKSTSLISSHQFLKYKLRRGATSSQGSYKFPDFV